MKFGFVLFELVFELVLLLLPDRKSFWSKWRSALLPLTIFIQPTNQIGISKAHKKKSLVYSYLNSVKVINMESFNCPQ